MAIAALSANLGIVPFTKELTLTLINIQDASRQNNRTVEVAMNTNTVSVFDLSPPEKLQLVEDLWDDLAATPSDIPVHEWQKNELARRKSNLINNPASGLSWNEVKLKARSRYVR